MYYILPSCEQKQLLLGRNVCGGQIHNENTPAIVFGPLTFGPRRHFAPLDIWLPYIWSPEDIWPYGHLAPKTFAPLGHLAPKYFIH